jgi:hypothetical protein
MLAILWVESYARTFSVYPCAFKYLIFETHFRCMQTNQIGFYKIQMCMFSQVHVCVFVVMSIHHKLCKSLPHNTAGEAYIAYRYVYLLYSVQFYFCLCKLIKFTFNSVYSWCIDIIESIYIHYMFRPN